MGKRQKLPTDKGTVLTNHAYKSETRTPGLADWQPKHILRMMKKLKKGT